MEFVFDQPTIPKDIIYWSEDACSSIAESLDDDYSNYEVYTSFDSSFCNDRPDLYQTCQVAVDAVKLRSGLLSKPSRYHELSSAPDTDSGFWHFYPTDEKDCVSEDHHNEMSPSNQKLAFPLFGGRKRSRMSKHAQIEMIQHQLSKPFRALSVLHIDLRKTVLPSILNHYASLNCTKARKLVRMRNEQSSEKSLSASSSHPSKELDDNEKERSESNSRKAEDEEDSLPFDCRKVEVSFNFSRPFYTNIFFDNIKLTTEKSTDESSSDDESAIICEADLG